VYEFINKNAQLVAATTVFLNDSANKKIRCDHSHNKTVVATIAIVQ